MRKPQLIIADELKTWPNTMEYHNKWVLARPISGESWISRFYLSFMVLIGKYDALKWAGQ